MATEKSSSLPVATSVDGADQIKVYRSRSTFLASITAIVGAIVSAATTALAGIVELATSAETITGTDAVRATTPAGVKAATDTPLQEIVSGTTYTIDSSTTATVLVFTSGSAIAVTLANSIPNGRMISWMQKGAGQITFAAGSGATMVNRQSHTKSAAQYAVGSIYCHANAGSAAALVLAGDTAA